MKDALNDWQTQPGFLSHGNHQLRCLKMGQGKKVILAFHGFGEEAISFEPLAKMLTKDYTVIAFDFPGKSSDLWIGKNKPDCKIMSYFIHRICEEFKVEKITLMGYSMGARPALCLMGYLSEKVEKLVLLAPDGLKRNIWYYLATHNFYGRLLLKQILKQPEKWMKYLEKLVNLNLVNKRWQQLAMNTLKDVDAREKIFVDWSFTRNFIPNKRFIIKKIRKKKIPLLLFMGAKDLIFPPEEGKQFIQGLPFAELHVLECGHHIMRDGNLADIASKI